MITMHLVIITQNLFAIKIRLIWHTFSLIFFKVQWKNFYQNM